MAKMRATEGIIRILIDDENWMLTVRYDPRRIDIPDIQRALDAATAAVDAEH